MDYEMAVVERHSQSAPVDLDAMFRDLGIEYSPSFNFGPESGWIERDGNRYRVMVNAFEPEVRQRFTAAHELAHYLLHRDLLDGEGRMNRHTDQLYDGPTSESNSPIKPYHEVQANKMAAQIIMPGALVRQYHSRGMSPAQLAAEFRVSKRAMEIRLETLGLTY